jgi:predicted glycogen debranching enzyme
MAANQETRLKTEEFDWEKYPVLETFKSAASTFVKNVDGQVQIWAASRDWFMEEWGRDTFVSLSGLLLVSGRFEDSRKVFRRFVKFEKDGLIPNKIDKDSVTWNTADAPMWFIQAVKKYLQYTKDMNFVNDMLPVMRRIIGAYKNGISYQRYGNDQVIRIDEDGLIISPAQATWMDADCFGKNQPVTPRNGKAVEINALWYDNLRFLSQIDNDYESLAVIVKKSFNKKFWNSSKKCLYDVIDGDSHGKAVRPNMIFAVSHGGDLLSASRQKMIVRKIEKELLTPGGLRTLSSKDSCYIGTYDTYLPVEQKDLAYHQGSAWPWLMGGFCDALVKVGKGKDIKKVLGPLARFCLESKYKSLPELFSGNPPYEPGGTTSQAWSVAEVLRVLAEHKIVE